MGYRGVVACNVTTTVSQAMYSLIYKSRCNGVVTWDMVNDILTASQRNNPSSGITGVLLATETRFLQFLEGEFEPLNATFERIARDPRHDMIQLISFGEVDERQFGDWGMHGIGLFDFNRDRVLQLCMKFGEENGTVRFPDTADGALQLLEAVLTAN